MRAARAGIFVKNPDALVAIAALAGCTDEKIVYRDKPLFEEAPATAAGS